MPDNEAPPPERTLTGPIVITYADCEMVAAISPKLVPEAKNVVEVVMMLASRADAAEAEVERLKRDLAAERQATLDYMKAKVERQDAKDDLLQEKARADAAEREVERYDQKDRQKTREINILVPENRELRARADRLAKALREILAIPNKTTGSDWDEISDARAIAAAALEEK